MTPGFVLTVPEVSPSAVMAWTRVMPTVGVGSGCRASSWMSFRPALVSDVTLIPAFHVVGTPALVLHVELRAAFRDPVVDQPGSRRVTRLTRDGLVPVRAFELDLAVHPGDREHRHSAVVAFEGPVGLEFAQHVSDLLRC